MTKRICVLTALVVFALPAAAGARIVVNQSIARVRLTETKQAVRHHLGAPAKIFTSNGLRQWVYTGPMLVVGLKNGRVVEVLTMSPRQRTTSGIGVGSSEAAVKSRIKGVTCQHVAGYTGQECVVTAPHGSSNWTSDFHIGTNGRVKSVLVNIL